MPQENGPRQELLDKLKAESYHGLADKHKPAPDTVDTARPWDITGEALADYISNKAKEDKSQYRRPHQYALPHIDYGPRDYKDALIALYEEREELAQAYRLMDDDARKSPHVRAQWNIWGQKERRLIGSKTPRLAKHKQVSHKAIMRQKTLTGRIAGYIGALHPPMRKDALYGLSIILAELTRITTTPEACHKADIDAAIWADTGKRAALSILAIRTGLSLKRTRAAIRRGISLNLVAKQENHTDKGRQIANTYHIHPDITRIAAKYDIITRNCESLEHKAERHLIDAPRRPQTESINKRIHAGLTALSDALKAKHAQNGTPSSTDYRYNQNKDNVDGAYQPRHWGFHENQAVPTQSYQHNNPHPALAPPDLGQARNISGARVSVFAYFTDHLYGKLCDAGGTEWFYASGFADYARFRRYICKWLTAGLCQHKIEACLCYAVARKISAFAYVEACLMGENDYV